MDANAGGQYVGLVEAWRRDLGMAHTAFAHWLGRHPTEWSHLRAGRRHPPQGFVRAVRGRALEPWLGALDAAYQRDALARVGGAGKDAA